MLSLRRHKRLHAKRRPPIVGKEELAAKLDELAGTDEGQALLVLLACIGRHARAELDASSLRARRQDH